VFAFSTTYFIFAVLLPIQSHQKSPSSICIHRSCFKP
jgi:hypothetical protein